jgi:hypothetical protein
MFDDTKREKYPAGEPFNSMSTIPDRTNAMEDENESLFMLKKRIFLVQLTVNSDDEASGFM